MSACRLVLALLLVGCASYQAEPIDPARVEESLRANELPALRIAAGRLHHPLLPHVVLDPRDGFSPDEAAIMAVLAHPTLRAARNRRSVARAQLVAAGILPNPELGLGLDVPVGNGATAGLVPGMSVGLSWEISALVTRGAKRTAAEAAAQSVDLEVAWLEWQVAESARMALFDVIALEAEQRVASESAAALADNEGIIERAVDNNQKTVVDLAAARAAARTARETLLEVSGNLRREQLALSRSLGFDGVAQVLVAPGLELPGAMHPPPAAELLAGLEDRRLDLVALRRGYDSQEAILRAAVLAQFPRLSFGVAGARDTSDVRTIGLGLGIGLPIFDRNQGQIAIERATRRRLYDEYIARLFEARAEVAAKIADIEVVTGQIAAAESSELGLAQLVEVYFTAVSQGRGDAVTYYFARGDLAQKRLEVLKLKQLLAHDRIALELAAGMVLPLDAGAKATEKP